MDPGLVRAVKRQLGPVGHEERGHILEGFVLTLLRAHQEARAIYDSIRYWSPAQAGQAEVDFVLERGGEYLAIEVKAGARFSNREIAGLRAIADLKGVARRVLVYGGSDVLGTDDEVDVWPLSRLLQALAEGTLWP